MADKGIMQRRPFGEISRARGVDPLEAFREMFQFDPFRELGLPVAVAGIGFTPSFEVKETQDQYLFKADVPGLKEADLDISITGNRLTVSGKREEEQRQDSDRFHLYERSFGAFTRSFTLPDGVDTEHMQADLKDGVLNIRVPKKQEVQARKIPLQRGPSASAPGKDVKA